MDQATALQDAAAFALAHETPWPRDPLTAPGPGQQPYGVHHDDPPPFNCLRGPLRERGGPSGVVWQNGRELIAWGDPERADPTFSVAKTYLALLAGLAQRRGLLPDVHAPVGHHLRGIGFEGPHNGVITWHHLLRQTSEWEGTCFGLPDRVDRWRKVGQDPRPASGDPSDAGPKGGARPLRTPGTYWEYNDVRINQLALALLHLFGRPLPEVFAEALMGPLGASSPWVWQGYDDAWAVIGGERMPSVPGGTHWGAGVSIGARDQARLAQLLLDEGRLGAQTLLDAAWLRCMQAPGDVAPFYGYLLWLNGSQRLFPAASARASAMQGAGGHLVLIEPELGAVVVARWLDPAATTPFVRRVLGALRAL